MGDEAQTTENPPPSPTPETTQTTIQVDTQAVQVSVTQLPRPSKSVLVDRNASSMSRPSASHVKLQIPHEEVVAVEVDRKRSELERKSRQLSTSAVRKGSTSSFRRSVDRSSKDLLRRKSDRYSKTKQAVGSIISIRKTSGYGEYVGGVRTMKYMNSYKLESDKPFHVDRVQEILNNVLTQALDNLMYDSSRCASQAKWASGAIRAKVKEQEYDRYKIICVVTIGEKRYHDMASVARFLWDCERDKYAVFVHENMHVFASAICFGIYYE